MFEPFPFLFPFTSIATSVFRDAAGRVSELGVHGLRFFSFLFSLDFKGRGPSLGWRLHGGSKFAFAGLASFFDLLHAVMT